MTNYDVVKAFYNKEKAKTENVESTCIKLYSYNTVIAEHSVVKRKPCIIKNVTKYSHTTSKHQSYVNKYDFTVDNLPIRTFDLKQYVK